MRAVGENRPRTVLVLVAGQSKLSWNKCVFNRAGNRWEDNILGMLCFWQPVKETCGGNYVLFGSWSNTTLVAGRKKTVLGIWSIALVLGRRNTKGYFTGTPSRDLFLKP